MSKATFGSIKTEVGIYKRKKSEILKLFFSLLMSWFQVASVFSLILIFSWTKACFLLFLLGR